MEAPNGANAQIQGDDISAYDPVTPTVRRGNYTQISRKTVIIAMTEEAVNKAGRKSEIGYQVAKKGKSLKRDVETILLQNQARAVGAAGTTAATLASILAWLHTNVSNVVAGGANPTGDGTNARTDGTTPVAFTESMLKTALASIWQNSGDEPDQILVNSNQKVAISTFTGNNTRYINADEEKLVTSIDRLAA